MSEYEKLMKELAEADAKAKAESNVRSAFEILVFIFSVLITVAAFLFVIAVIIGLWKFMWYVIGL